MLFFLRKKLESGLFSTRKSGFSSKAQVGNSHLTVSLQMRKVPFLSTVRKGTAVERTARRRDFLATPQLLSNHLLTPQNIMNWHPNQKPWWGMLPVGVWQRGWLPRRC